MPYMKYSYVDDYISVDIFRDRGFRRCLQKLNAVEFPSYVNTFLNKQGLTAYSFKNIYCTCTESGRLSLV